MSAEWLLEATNFFVYFLLHVQLGSGMASAAPQGFQAITSGEVAAPVDIEMQDWLRVNFTPAAHTSKSALDAKSRFRKAGLGVFAVENILKGVKAVGNTQVPALPIEVSRCCLHCRWTAACAFANAWTVSDFVTVWFAGCS